MVGVEVRVEFPADMAWVTEVGALRAAHCGPAAFTCCQASAPGGPLAWHQGAGPWSTPGGVGWFDLVVASFVGHHGRGSRTSAPAGGEGRFEPQSFAVCRTA